MTAYGSKVVRGAAVCGGGGGGGGPGFCHCGKKNGLIFGNIPK